MQGLDTATFKAQQTNQPNPSKKTLIKQKQNKQTIKQTAPHPTRKTGKDLKTHTKSKRKETERLPTFTFSNRKKSLLQIIDFDKLGFRKSYTFFQFNIAATQRGIHSVAMVFHLHYGLVSQLPNAEMITTI